jgi:hypothetical protein
MASIVAERMIRSLRRLSHPCCLRAVIAIMALRRVLYSNKGEVGDQEFPRCAITNGHMSCGPRFPPKRKRSQRRKLLVPPRAAF